MIKVWNELFKIHPEYKGSDLAAFVTSEYLAKKLNLMKEQETLLVCQHVSWVSNPDCLDWFKKNPPAVIHSIVPHPYWGQDVKSVQLEYFVYAFKKNFRGTPMMHWLSPPRGSNVPILPSKESPKRKRFQFYLAKAKR